MIINNVVVLRLCVVVCWTAIGALAYAQPLDVDKVNQIKAAYIYHIAQLTTWPAEEIDNRDALRVVFVGQETAELANILAANTSSLHVHGHRIVVSYIPTSLLYSEPALAFQDSIKNAHILYVSEGSSERALMLCRQNKGRPLLIAGDGQNMPHDGGMIGFYVDDQRVRINVNLENVESSALKMSAEFLQHVTLVTPDKRER